MAALFWANLIDFYQPPNCDRSTLEKIVQQSYLPLLRVFEQTPTTGFTINLPGSTIDLLIKTGFGKVIKKIAQLAERGQIDFTMTPKYQPLIPLMDDDDIDRQIDAHNKICKRYFGIDYKPQGFYSPFLAYSPKVAKAAARFALKWVAIDEYSIRYKNQGGINALFMDKSAGGILLMGCHREVSDLLGGSFRLQKVPRSAAEFMQMSAKKISSDRYFITRLDARNIGYDNPGRHGFLRALLKDNKLKPVTVTQLRRFIKRKDFARGVDGSIYTPANNSKKRKPFGLWNNPQNQIQQTLWKLFKMGLTEVRNAGAKGDSQCVRARDMYDSASAGLNWASASCSPWWEKKYPQQAADDLSIAIFVLMSTSPKVKDLAINLRIDLYEQVEAFEKSGEHKKLQKSFLKANNIQYDRFLKFR